MININIVKEFPFLPGPRKKEQGPGSGEEFLNMLLEPRFLEAKNKNQKLMIIFDGARYGYPASFLEESFGGLARKHGISEVKDVLQFKSVNEPLLEREVLEYINRANEIRGD